MAAGILAGVGVVLLAGGLLTREFFPRWLDAERVRIENLPQVDAVALRSLPVGRDVLLEGRISPSQPTLFRDFVAYSRQDREQTDGYSKPWRGRETKLQPLVIEQPDGRGRVRVENATYDMLDPVTEWADPRVNGRIETRYIGLTGGEAVLVVGRVASPASPHSSRSTIEAEVAGLNAEFVTPGTRAAYLDGRARAKTVAVWLGGGLAGVGTLLLLIAFALVLVKR